MDHLSGTCDKSIAKAPSRNRVSRTVILFRGTGSEVMICRGESGVRLPRVVLSGRGKVNESANQDICSQFGVSAYSLFTVRAPSSEPGFHTYEVMVAQENTALAPAHCTWIPVDQIAHERFNREDSFAIVSAIREMRSYARGLNIGPFGKPGWLEELLCWIRQEIDPLGLHMSGNIRQFNPCPTLALLRFETDGPAVWFKAVDESNKREVSITSVLSREFPPYLPELIATHPSLCGWLTRECEGLTLGESASSAAWGLAAETLAKLQVKSLRKTSQLLSAGCIDIRLEELLKHVDAFVEVTAELMEQQRNPSPPALAKKDVIRLGVSIKKACEDWARFKIPDALGHMDLNPLNIVVSADRCVFLDWAEAFVGPPFFAVDFLRGHCEQARPAERSSTAAIAAGYTKPWQSVLPAAVVSKGIKLSRFLAPFAYAITTGDWWNSGRFPGPENAGYLRSLTRRMHRECQSLQGEGFICLNS